MDDGRIVTERSATHEKRVRMGGGKCSTKSSATDRLPEQNLVEPPVLGVERRPLEEDLGREPPVGDEDLLARRLHRVGHVPHVVAAVHVPAGPARAVADRRERLVPVRLDKLLTWGAGGGEDSQALWGGAE